eukprot:CAMPEP_0181522152 /NCGR_PEP_ID=MMETSP1110-20121109/67221_1 /TAXON_ID=174948 /ORGANISM="Symbiodinium sp., Strain CCMP421" /LENGTH=78 /DNA_ID=CAMNT_0023652749 /DNA_START=474 /DNA_END=707 /DNA_ORIENTATION=+
MLHIVHAGATLASAYGPMKPPRSGFATPAGQKRSRVRPWPRCGAGTPHPKHGPRIKAHALFSEIRNGTPCFSAIRRYA